MEEYNDEEYESIKDSADEYYDNYSLGFAPRWDPENYASYNNYIYNNEDYNSGYESN